MGNSSFMEMEEALADIRNFSGGQYGYALLVVTALCAVFLIKAGWNCYLQGLKSIALKGSFGWPFFGETLSVIRCGSNYPFELWAQQRIKRFGSAFKSHLFLAPSVILTAPEELKLFFDDPNRELNSGTPWALKQIFGPSSLINLNGKDHTNMHKLLADSLLLPELKRKVADMDRLMVHTVNSWAGKTVELVTGIQDILLKLMTINFFGIPWEHELADQIVALLLPAVLGITSIPIYFPGTCFYAARNARSKLDELLLPIIREVRNPQASEASKYATMDKSPYQNLFECEMNGEEISDAAICDILMGTVLSGIHAPTNATAFAIKYLSENPSTLQKVRAETQQLKKMKEESGDTAFSTSDLKELKYTIQVFNEVLRITTITPGSARETTSDLNFNGYVIPKGWRVFAALAPLHMDPETYPEPSKFDPDRFESPPNSKKFLPFGRGRRACVGRDITKLFVVMNLYHITTKLTWDIVSSGGKTNSFPITRMTKNFELAFKPLPQSP